MNSDLGTARSIAREYLALYFSLPNYLSNLRRLGFADEDFAGGGSDRIVDALVPSGDAKAVAQRVHQHFDAGGDHVCIQPLGRHRTVDLTGLAELRQILG